MLGAVTAAPDEQITLVQTELQIEGKAAADQQPFNFLDQAVLVLLLLDIRFKEELWDILQK
jgi:hypothetical protein